MSFRHAHQSPATVHDGKFGQIVLRYIPVKSTDFGGSLPIFFYLFYLPTANLPIYHNLPISTDFFADLPNFNFFYRSFCYFM